MTFSVSSFSGQVRTTKSACGSSVFRSVRACAESAASQPECLGKLRQTTSDATQTDDQQRLAAEFVFALSTIGNHAAPDVLGLIVACLGQLPRHREHSAIACS